MATKSQRAAPPLPHITANMIPLSSILFFSAQNAYQRLTTTVENLSSTVDTDTDAARKQSFLATIIDLRHDFVKLYTLVKWAQNARDVSQLIDLLNWLRQHDMYFDQLALGLHELNRYSGAKWPNADIPTALEVLIEGRPQLPSYGLLPLRPVLPHRTLQVLQDLNICLTARMVFEERFPPRFAGYVVRDGRVTFTVPREFSVSVTVGNDTVVESPADYAQSPYYFIDFCFLFAVSADGETLVEDCSDRRENQRAKGTSGEEDLSRKDQTNHIQKPLIQFQTDSPSDSQMNSQFGTPSQNQVAPLRPHAYLTPDIDTFSQNASLHTQLPPAALRKLEHAANAALLTHGLEGLYTLLHRYAVSFKIYLLSRQLAHLCTVSKWKGSVQFRYFGDRLVLVANYWSQQHLSRNWRSFVEIGVCKDHTLAVRWFRNGLYTHHDFEIAEGSGPSRTAVLSLDFMLTMVANRHAESLVGQIYSQLEEAVGSDSASVSLLTPHQLLLSVAPKTLALFALNPLTGLFYFSDPSPLYSRCASRVNAPPPAAKTKTFVSESETIAHVVASILHLRLDTFSQQLHNRLVTAEWIHNTIIKLSDSETTRLASDNEPETTHAKEYKLDKTSEKTDKKTLQRLHFYRCKNWPSSWFLIILCSGTSFATSWWVTRIKSMRGDWRIQWLQMLARDAAPQSLDYAFFSGLATRCSNMIIDHIVHDELDQRSIQYVSGVEDLFLEGKETRRNEEKPIEVKREIEDQKMEEAHPKMEDKSSVQNGATSATPSGASRLYSLTMALYNDGSLLPIDSSATVIFLKITLMHHHNSTHMELRLTGELRGIDLTSVSGLELVVFRKNGKQQFALTSSVDLSGTMNDTSSSAESKVLSRLFSSLTRLRHTIQLTIVLRKWNIDIVEYAADGIAVQVDDIFGTLKVRLAQSDGESAELQKVPNTKPPTSGIDAETLLVLRFINQYLASPQSDTIVGVVQYLRCVAPVFRAISAIKQSMAQLDSMPEGRLANNSRRLEFDVKLRELNFIQFVFHIKYTSANAPKRILKDRIVICLCLRVNKFARRQLYLKMSLRDNANQKNLKHKKLFEMIFRAITEFELAQKLKRADLVKLNYEFLVDYNLADKLLTTVAECFPRYVKEMLEIS